MQQIELELEGGGVLTVSLRASLDAMPAVKQRPLVLQHQRPLLHGGHGVQRRPQGNRQHTAALKFQLYLLHPSSSL